ncbi:MAG: hypothetical protein A2534_05205 [Candidatus Magasanikbacteria bacterium RIFOXYD2_FULL_39_9]|uniref:Haloacid dehalogenase n=1 Tax=Candidatus Magasanikbacteria bacterium RIFOXYD1_FULL_40_23 TaxID=1798705 RepID=A0A1F6P9H8_9BACT|nr:MAG: hypothetical protein A2563_04230 [Candidatus Magasanikbacteria bacterium RIFOXYD1_FULL_40_23]OGH93458.1 MAG: hypothetical protein A2534_05205 [Candidatus Magasanikbacteria bacterium RIFOXYD2_FULL_39_9]
MKIQGFAFDLEGTVVNVEPAHHNAHFATAAEVGLEINSDNAFQLLPHFIGGPDIKVMEDIWALSQKKVSPGELLKRKQFHYEQLLATMDVAPRRGFRHFFNTVVDLGLSVSIGSLTPMVQARVLLDRSGVGKVIGEANIVLAEHVQNHKPAPDVFLETARRMGINPTRQLVFEDSPRGVQAAISAGSRAVGMPVYNRPEATVPLIQAGVCRLFMEWDEISVLPFLQNLAM